MTRGISNRRATYVRWDEFPKIKLRLLPAQAKDEFMPVWISDPLSLLFLPAELSPIRVPKIFRGKIFAVEIERPIPAFDMVYLQNAMIQGI